MKEDIIAFWKTEKIITDKAVIDAFNAVPRELFVLEKFAEQAYEDYPLQIAAGQTISQPTTVAIMTQLLELKQGQKVLEVGTGSGYQAAIISHIVREKGKVVTTEIIKELADFSRKNIEKLKIKNIEILNIDGSRGYDGEAPYDRIIMTAAAPEIPKQLIEQLKIGGILVAPIGPAYGQDLVKVIKRKGKLETSSISGFIFVPLKGEHGYERA